MGAGIAIAGIWLGAALICWKANNETRWGVGFYAVIATALAGHLIK